MITKNGQAKTACANKKPAKKELIFFLFSFVQRITSDNNKKPIPNVLYEKAGIPKGVKIKKTKLAIHDPT